MSTSVARRWSHAATSARQHPLQSNGGFSSSETDQGFRNRVNRRKSHFDKTESIRELNDLKETSPLEPIRLNSSRESLLEESDVFSGYS